MTFPYANCTQGLCRMYADDTTLTCSAEDADTLLQVKLRSDLSKIPTWLKVNKLTLNVKKTKYLLIGSRPKLELLSDNFTVKVNNIPIERVTVYKSLGVSIDKNLSWKTHIDKISKTTSAGLSVLRRVSRTILFTIRETIYKALIVPCFDCSSCVWGYIGKGLSEKPQNRVDRIVTLSNNETRFKDLLDKLGWEVLEDGRIRQLVVLMFKITHNISLPYDECL